MIINIKKKILFYGEVYPDVIHGVSLANKLNIDILSSSHYIDIVKEKSSIYNIGRISLLKIKEGIRSIIEIKELVKNNNYNGFYIVLSLSTIGIIKTLLPIMLYRFYHNENIILHLHRGDFYSFYNKCIINKYIAKYCFKKSNRLIVLSPNQKHEMSQYFPTESIYAVENSVLKEYFYPEKQEFKNNFIYISNYINEKGIFDLLTAFTCLHGLNLNCYGAYSDNKTELDNFQSKSITINCVIDGKKKFDVLHDSDALILPSWNEGQPIILLEAMMVGTIILTTKVGLIGEMLGNEYPFYFDPKKPQDIEECVRRFMEYPDIDKKILSKFLRKKYLDNYSHNIHTLKIINAFS